MAELKSFNKSDVQTKESFVTKKALTAPKTPRVKTYEDDNDFNSCIRLCFFGGVGTGKTYTAYELLVMGFKIFYFSTDVGGGGVETVEIECRKNGRQDLLRTSLRSVEFSSYDEVLQFLDDPASIYPDIYDFDPDFLFWDGFACWQQVNVSEFVGSLAPSVTSTGKEVNEAVAEGLQFETAQWGQVRNATIRAIAKYMGLRNKKTGRVWNKIVTAHEEIKMKPNKIGSSEPYTEEGYPMISGKAFNLFCGAFTALIRTKKYDGKFYFSTGKDNKVAKARGISLGPDEQMEASMEKLWALLSIKE